MKARVKARVKARLRCDLIRIGQRSRYNSLDCWKQQPKNLRQFEAKRFKELRAQTVC